MFHNGCQATRTTCQHYKSLLPALSIPAANTINPCCQHYQSMLPTLSIPAASTINPCCQHYQSLLPALSIPAASTINPCCQYYQSLLPILSIPAANTINPCCQHYQSMLPTLSIPAASTINPCCQHYQSLLPALSIPAASTKVSLLTEFKAVLDEYFEEKKEEFKSFIESKKVELQVSKELSESVRVIQQHVNTLKAENIMLKKSVENLQQYVRRPNIRIFVLPNESSEEVNKFVLGMITNNNIDIPISSIDRAHRISRNHPNQEVQPTIVRFTSFRDRTVFYRARKSIKDKSRLGVSVDLTTSPQMENICYLILLPTCNV